ncbi:MAG: alpha-D-ribose 1-methylphosphonate 5-triphosphate synthase subunit PhnH [Clostridiales bacterium]|nr:alpha-D-ribose 1-methylphosphonate 5-triphosphate synthase subunit PhnH [Clostridiales bacterium]
MADIQMEIFDEVFDSQCIYRNILDAIARSGTVKDIGDIAAKLFSIEGFSKTAAAISLTLLDEYAKFAVVYKHKESVERYIKWNTRAPIADILYADYIFAGKSVSESEIMGIFDEAKKGNLVQPDDSATLIIEVDKIAEGRCDDALTIRLKGPGIERENICSIKGLSPLWFIKRNETISEFPMGVDMIFASDDGHTMVLPRTTKVELDGEWFLWDM